MSSVLSTLSALLSVYALLCTARVFLSWVPHLSHSPLGEFLSAICEPYLSWFRRFSFMRVGTVDYSPMIAIGVLTILSNTVGTIFLVGSVSVLKLLLQMLMLLLWSLCKFVLEFLLILFAVRFVSDRMNVNVHTLFFVMMDRILNPVRVALTAPFKFLDLSYRASLLLCVLVILCARVLGGFFVNVVVRYFLTGTLHVEVM